MASEGVRAKGLIAGLVLSLSIVVLFAARMDWAQFRGALVDVRWQWVAAGCAGLVLAITIRAVLMLVMSYLLLPPTSVCSPSF